MEKSYLVILAVTIVGDVQSSWLNRLDQPLYFECPSGQSIYKIRSKHYNHEEDRQWDLQCRDSSAYGSCFWTGFLNQYDGLVSHRCPNNAVVSGMYSEHSNHHEDRIFKVKCCSLSETDGSDLRFVKTINPLNCETVYIQSSLKATYICKIVYVLFIIMEYVKTW
ncbi:hypothetical protein KUTeg_007362 [Tegillarca granosa]|uniref:Dermatopontin n=1 Tax=Tegillarca granosa TaxID=220873 RepID=A0ABQ9FFF2_TEGGR|nr:hypothetical protein KUTeg_007362 [Tegillarca granosa]